MYRLIQFEEDHIWKMTFVVNHRFTLYCLKHFLNESLIPVTNYLLGISIAKSYFVTDGAGFFCIGRIGNGNSLSIHR